MRLPATGGATVDGEPTTAPVADADGRAGSVVARRPVTGRSWVIVVLVGVPLLSVPALWLSAIHFNNAVIGSGVGILAPYVACRVAGIHGVGRWIVAWLLIYTLTAVVGFLAYFISLASGSGVGPP
jgi:hypothetical protein